MGVRLVTLHEAADRMGKSVQTLRRMIRKGELQTERVQTPQGFQYWVNLETTEAGPEPEIEPEFEPEPEPEPEPKVELAPKVEPELKLETPVHSKEAHEERMFFLRLIERLQNELDHERKKPRSLFGFLADWWTQLF